MAPAVGKPWLVTLRSTRNSASPTSTRTTPMAGAITIVSKAPPILSGGMRATLTSSVGSDFTAHRQEAFCKVVARDILRIRSTAPHALNVPMPSSKGTLPEALTHWVEYCKVCVCTLTCKPSSARSSG
jgi:hypothetical protein